MQMYSAVRVYIVAHQDDWQLFMTPDAYDDLVDKQTRVAFIYTTAGDAGKDSGYWLAREKGALSSVQYALDTPASPPTEVTNSQPIFNNHPIHCCEYKRSASYFLRLPDGRMTGKGSERYEYQSLTHLHKGEISAIAAIDQSTVYHGWGDLCQTLAAIIEQEASGCRDVSLHTSNFWLVNNFADNADHLTTGVATKAVHELLGKKYPVTLYLDYDMDVLRPNLTPQQILHKTSLFTAYDLTVQAASGHCTHCETDFYLHWCLRQYSRPMHDERPMRQVPFHILKLFGMFRRWRGLEQLTPRH